MAPELNAWTQMAAQAFGMYAGINEAMKLTRGTLGSVADYARDVRQQMILMALIRAFAVMDRDSAVSFQSVHRCLREPDSFDRIARGYAESEPKSSIEGAVATCRDAIDKFCNAYRSVDFKAFGRIQSFRNSDIAHISWPEARRAKVTNSDIEALVIGCCEMAGQLSLMVSGRNDWPIETLDEARSAAYRFWLSALTPPTIA